MIDDKAKKNYQKQAEVVQSLAHPIRIAIADLLKDGEQCVCDIAEHIGAERSNVSRHLALMLNSGVLQTRKEGVMVYYSLRTPCILNFLNCASNVLRINLEEDVATLTPGPPPELPPELHPELHPGSPEELPDQSGSILRLPISPGTSE